MPRTHRCLMLLAAALAAPVAAQSYPSKPVRIVVPYAPGGTTDILTRAVGPKLTEAWGQPIIVDNRPGASGMIGAEIAAKAPPDGYTLLMSYTAEIAITVSLFKKISYDPLRDLAPISLGAVTPLILVVHPSLPVKSVKELIALARAKPKALPYASAGNGSPAHLAFELMQRSGKIELTHVPYKGAAPAVVDLVGGHVVMFFSGMPPAMPHVRSGRMRALAVSTAKRSPAAPEVPTMAESGMPGFDIPTWFGLFAPAATPREVITKVHGDFVKALGASDVKARLIPEGAEPSPMTPEQFGQFVRSETAKYAQIIRDSNIKPD
ncbi:MAG: tripartite tricarboxylate transporter substrate binding protein [Betaproteobacteria bacterium]|nr:tripartite tricarboxylate transporter substrate binding protein [Betaproteobacteria bacterium]